MVACLGKKFLKKTRFVESVKSRKSVCNEATFLTLAIGNQTNYKDSNFVDQGIRSWKTDILSDSSFPLSFHSESDFSASRTCVMASFTQKQCSANIFIH